MERSATRLSALLGIFLAALLALAPAPVAAKDGKGPGYRQEKAERSDGRHDKGRPGPSASGYASDEELERWWRELPDQERDRYRQRYEELRKLPPEQRDRLRGRWERFRDLPPEQQDQLRQRYQRWKDLPSAERERLKQTWRHYRQLPPQEQELLKKELRSLRDLPVPERERRRQELHRRYFPDLPPPPPRERRP